VLNSAQECPDIDLYVYFVCAFAFPSRDPSISLSLSLSLSRSLSLSLPSISLSLCLSLATSLHPLQLCTFQPIAYRVRLQCAGVHLPPHSTRRHPGATKPLPRPPPPSPCGSLRWSDRCPTLADETRAWCKPLKCALLNSLMSPCVSHDG